jgi:hypothetical protein
MSLVSKINISPFGSIKEAFRGNDIFYNHKYIMIGSQTLRSRPSGLYPGGSAVIFYIKTSQD